MKQLLHVQPTDYSVCALLNGIPYGSAPYWYGTTQRPLCLDLILPKDLGKRHGLPLIIWMCGGAFQQQDRSLWMPALMPFAMRGFAVACVDYRVSAQAPYPAAVQDVKQAIRFLRAHCESFGLDPHRFVAMGESAGGYLAAMAAVQDSSFETGDWMEASSAVQAVVDYYGKVDLSQVGEDPTCNRVIADFMEAKDTESLKASSPLYRVEAGMPPFLIFHGDQDPLVPVRESEALYEALREKNVRADLYLLQGEGHGTEAFYQPQMQEIVLGFLREVLRLEA